MTLWGLVLFGLVPERRGMEEIMDENIKNALTCPFDRALIKERIGPGGRPLSYVSIADYVGRLNEAFDFDWGYEITDARILDEEVVVQIRLTAGGMVKMGMGGAAITKRRDDGKPVSIAHDLMAAEASGLKRACRLLGIGAALYVDDDDVPAPANHNTRTQHQQRQRDQQHLNAPSGTWQNRSPRSASPEVASYQNDMPSNTNAPTHESRSDLMTPAQRRLLFRIAAERGVPTDDIQRWLENHVGLKSLNGLGKYEASRLIERLKANVHTGAAQ